MKRSREERERKSRVFNVKICLPYYYWIEICEVANHRHRTPFLPKRASLSVVAPSIDFSLPLSSRNWFADRNITADLCCKITMNTHTDDMCSQTMRAGNIRRNIFSRGSSVVSSVARRTLVPLCLVSTSLQLDFAFSLYLCSPLLWSLLFSPVSPDSWILKNHWKEHFCEYL